MNAIPDSLRSRIQKLLALANDARGNEHEAQAAAAKVQTLLGEYNLELSQLIESDEDEINPDAVREKASNAIETKTLWQYNLFDAIAANNFVMRFVDSFGEGETRTHSLVGRKLNIATTLQVYNYLTGSIDRLCPFTDRRTKAFRSWKEGCADRLRGRLQDQRWASERASREAATVKTANSGSGSGSDLVLSDVYSTEDDLNRDFRFGYAPGTTARERAAQRAKWEAEAEARRNAPVAAAPERNETEAQRRKREAKETADNERYWARYRRQQAKEAARRDQNAYAMGANAGAQISLDQQIGGNDPIRKLA
jgi:hypothetical protein